MPALVTPTTCPLYGARFKADPHPSYAALREAAPVCRRPGRTGQAPVWFVTGYAEACYVLDHPQLFVNDVRAARPAGRTGAPPRLRSHLLNRDGAEHRRLRALLRSSLRRPVVDALRPRIRTLASDLVDRVRPRGAMELVAEFALPLPMTVLADVVGFPRSDVPRLSSWAVALLIQEDEAAPPADVAAQRAAFVDYVEGLCAARCRVPRADLLTLLAQGRSAGQLSVAEVTSTVATMLVAGHETTTKTLCTAVLALLAQPDEYARLVRHPDRIPEGLDELLRYDGAAERAVTRWAVRDVELGGCRIRRGEAVVVVLAAANRDPAAFAAPDRLDLARRPRRHLGFGRGVHYCPGAYLARTELAIALEALVTRLPGLHTAVPPEELSWSLTPALRGPRALPLRWDP